MIIQKRNREMPKNRIIVLLGLIALIGAVLFMTSCSETTASEKKYSIMLSKGAEPSGGIGRENKEPIAPEIVYEPKNYTICVDPGHGFVDGGTGENIFENGVLEKDITIAVSKLLRTYLEERGFEVIMTHDGINVPSADVNGNNISIRKSVRHMQILLISTILCPYT